MGIGVRAGNPSVTACGGRRTGGGRPHRAAPTGGYREGRQIRGNGRGRSPAPTQLPEVSAAGRCRHRPLRSAGGGVSRTLPPTKGRGRRIAVSACGLLAMTAFLSFRGAKRRGNPFFLMAFWLRGACSGGPVGPPLRGYREGRRIRGNGRGRSPAPTQLPEVSAAGRCRIGPYGVRGTGRWGRRPLRKGRGLAAGCGHPALRREDGVGIGVPVGDPSVTAEP